MFQIGGRNYSLFLFSKEEKEKKSSLEDPFQRIFLLFKEKQTKLPFGPYDPQLVPTILRSFGPYYLQSVPTILRPFSPYDMQSVPTILRPFGSMIRKRSLLPNIWVDFILFELTWVYSTMLG